MNCFFIANLSPDRQRSFAIYPSPANASFGTSVTNYPAVLFVCGDKDSRCNPAHTRKMAARLGDRRAQKHAILVDHSAERGHAPTMPLSIRIDSLTHRIAFLCHELGVPPAHYIAIREGEITIRPHWHSIEDTSIVYQSEGEYDEHFLHLFRNAVQRRVGSGARVLAELSGGMDSSSIVCMADHIVGGGPDPSDLVDTISYYDDTEPDWNERPYFTAVEKRRRKVGIHLDCSSRTPSYQPLELPDRIYPYPGRDSSSLDVANQFEQTIGPGRYRAILSGFGGDELLGGVPTPMPELADYLRAGQLLKLLLRASEWCAIGRQPLIHMLHDTATFTNSLYRDPRDLKQIRPPWLSLGLQRMRIGSYAPKESMRALLMARPSAITNGRAWWALVEDLPHSAPHLVGCYEYRYPYLDRDLVEFLHRIPRSQLAQPGRRRFLMRRALKRIVPPEILERRRKAHISRGPIVNLRSAQQKIEELFVNPLSSDAGLVDRDKFLLAFRSELAGDLRWIGPVIKTISIELWLRSLTESHVSLRADSHSRDSNELRTDNHRSIKLRAGSARN